MRACHWPRCLLIVTSSFITLAAAGMVRAGAADADVVEVSVPELEARMASGQLTSERITQACLSRIQRLDGPLKAVLAVNPDALEQARSLDLERRQGNVRGPLHGIPVLLKDNIESLDPMPTTAGSLALAGNRTGRDAFVTSRLRAAGMVILGKTNLSEWANFRSEHSSSGWSGVGGQTANPYDTTRSPCGSSSGSGVAVAMSFAPLAVGTETDGSIVCPASVNGVVGIKPTVGLVSRSGIVPISHTQDTAGPMARSLADAVALLAAMIGVDEADPATSAPAQPAASWHLADFLTPDGLAGKRIGVVRSLAGFHPEVDRLFDRAIADIAAAGATIVDGLKIEQDEAFDKASYDVLLYEFKHDLNAYLARIPHTESLPARTLDELIAFNKAHRDAEMPFFGQEIFEKSQAMGPLSDDAYAKDLALVRRACRQDGIDRLVTENHLDALIAPTGAPAWKIDLIDGDHFMGASSTPAAVAGYPDVTVPMGAVHGLPVGLSFFGPALSEPTLIEAAFAYEQATHRRKPPRL